MDGITRSFKRFTTRLSRITARTSRDDTKPYDGILPMLDALAAKGVKLAIVSNKIDFAVKGVEPRLFRQSDAGGDWRRSEPQTQARAGQRAGSHASDSGVTREETVLHRRFGCGCGNGAQRGRGLLRGELGVFAAVESLKEAGAERSRRQTRRRCWPCWRRCEAAV